MVTQARRCAGCGSPLPETAPGTRQLTCKFCGLVNDLSHAAAGADGGGQSVTIRVDLGDATQAIAPAGKAIGKIVLAIVLLVVAIAGFTIYQATKSAGDIVKTVTSEVSNQISVTRKSGRAIAAGGGAAKMAPSGLAAITELGWKELDVPTPSSGWATFEPVTDLGWAMQIARAWQKDARLTRIDVERANEGGTIDLTAGADNNAGYRFLSPAQIENWGRLADRDSKVEVGYELMIKLAEQKVTALVMRGQPRREELPPPDVDTYPLPELLAMAKKGRGFGAYPFYKGYLIHLEREGWVWYLQSLSGRESLPRVRARDGAVYPYRR